MMKSVVLGETHAASSLIADAGTLTWLETDASGGKDTRGGRRRVMTMAMTDRVVRPLAGDLPGNDLEGVSLAMVGGRPYVASRELGGVFVVRDGAVEPFVRFEGANAIRLARGSDLVAVVLRGPAPSSPPRMTKTKAKAAPVKLLRGEYDLLRIDAATGACRSILRFPEEHDRPKVVVNAKGVWTIRLEVHDRVDKAPARNRDGVDVHVSEARATSSLYLEKEPLCDAFPLGKALVPGESSVFAADSYRIVRVDADGTVVHFASENGVSLLVEWRGGVAWVDYDTIYAVGVPGAQKKLVWKAPEGHSVRSLVTQGDDLIAVVDPETDPFAAATGAGAMASLVCLSGT